MAEHSSELNDTLFRMRNDAIKAYEELKEAGPVSVSSLQRKLQFEAEKHLLLDFCKQRLVELENNRQYGSRQKYGDTISKLENYLETNHKKQLLISEVDAPLIDGFRNYLFSLKNHRDSEGINSLSPNTIVKHLKVLRAILSSAIEHGLINSNPMAGMEIKETPTVTRHLNNSEIQKLQKAHFKSGSGLDNARNLYLFAIYTAGMRISDVLSLRWRNIIDKGDQVRVNYVMTKNKKPTDIILVDDAKSILEKYKNKTSAPNDYIFPYLDNSADYARYKTFNDIQTMPKDIHKKLFRAINSKEAQVNKELHNVADMIGIEAFTFHSARRDFARLANDAGVKCLEVQDLLAHESLTTTERYMRTFDTSAKDNALEKTFSGETRERKALSLVRELASLGYGKSDVKRLFDEAKKGH
ncbi:MAG: site-specific integrase [Bacteroidales bacterium]|nr:site-specific integrase [Bacteroidales bacterium]